MNRIVYILILSLFFIQCEENKSTRVQFSDVPGRYIHLDIENIYLFVPENIRLYSYNEYVTLVNDLKNEEFKKAQKERLLDLKYGNAGNFYLMVSDDFKTDITLRIVPYITIDQESSQMILKYLNREHKAFGKILGCESSFSRANIIKKGNDRIFRAIFLYKGIDILTGKQKELYTYYYLINKKGKTFVLSINSEQPNDFDSYVQKIRL